MNTGIFSKNLLLIGALTTAALLTGATVWADSNSGDRPNLPTVEKQLGKKTIIANTSEDATPPPVNEVTLNTKEVPHHTGLLDMR